METNAIAEVKKNLLNRTASFENELVPLNGSIVLLVFCLSVCLSLWENA